MDDRDRRLIPGISLCVLVRGVAQGGGGNWGELETRFATKFRKTRGKNLSSAAFTNVHLESFGGWDVNLARKLRLSLKRGRIRSWKEKLEGI